MMKFCIDARPRYNRVANGALFFNRAWLFRWCAATRPDHPNPLDPLRHGKSFLQDKSPLVPNTPSEIYF